MIANVIKLGFICLDAVNFEAMKVHYGRVLGLPLHAEGADQAIFSCGNDKVAIVLQKGERAGCTSVGLVVGANEDLEQIAAAAREAGFNASVQSNLFGVIPACVAISDPDGLTLYLYNDNASQRSVTSAVGINPVKLGHVAFYVKDARESEKFYGEQLGFRWSDWLGEAFIFMRCNVDHHAMNFMSHANRGMYHMAFEVKDFPHLGRACDIMAEEGVNILWGPGRHGPGHNIFTYHRDPDNNIIEVFTELDKMSNEALGYFDPRPHHTDSPQRPRTWDITDTKVVNSWGTPRPNTMNTPGADAKR